MGQEKTPQVRQETSDGLSISKKKRAKYQHKSIFDNRISDTSDQQLPNKKNAFLSRTPLQQSLTKVPTNSSNSFVYQPKLTIGQPNDFYEKEADRIAEAVIRSSSVASSSTHNPDLSTLATKIHPLPSSNLESIQSNDTDNDVDITEEDSENTSGKFLQTRPLTSGIPPENPADSRTNIDFVFHGGKPLAPDTQTFFESRFGQDFSQVRVHTNAAQTQSLNALAFSVGHNIVFRPGQYSPYSIAGKKLLAHELTHVVQQTGCQLSNPRIQRVVAPAKVVSSSSTSEIEPVPQEAEAPQLIVADEIARLEPGQMRKSDFLRALRTTVCAAAETMLMNTGRTTEGCPYLDYWFDYYSEQNSQHIERVVHRYAPETTRANTAQDYVQIVTARAQRAIEIWLSTGEITQVPEEVASVAIEPSARRAPEEVSSGEAVQFKAEGEPPLSDADPRDIRTQLGPGRPFGGNIRSRMDAAFKTSFSNVKIHDDPKSRFLARHYKARAFTVGEHIAFGTGEYQPGTIIGDALIAHELAHVIQQDEALPPAQPGKSNGLDNKLFEKSADQSAINAVLALWAKKLSSLIDFRDESTAELKTGLQLQRCDTEPVSDSEDFRRSFLQSTAVFELRQLYARKERILSGDEPISDLDQINQEIDQLIAALRELGVLADEESIYEDIRAEENLFEVGGNLIKITAEPNFIGQRIQFQVVPDYVSPGRELQIGWRWRTQGREYQFLARGRRSTERSLTLDEAFWNLVSEPQQEGTIEVIAYLYLGDETTHAVRLSSGQITLQQTIPDSIEISTSQTVAIVGSQVEFRIAEWVPQRAAYSIDWYEGSTLLVEDRPILKHSFTDAGRKRIAARVYSVRRAFGIRDRELFQRADIEIEVQDPETAGRELLGQIDASDVPTLGELESSIVASIAEIQQRVNRGGERLSYWEARLEAQQSRLANLRRHVSRPNQTQALPEDPTQVTEDQRYSGPIPAVLVMPSAGGAQPLSVYLVTSEDEDRWQATLIDATSADVWTFEGEGSTPIEAYQQAFNDWQDDHPYPRGGRVVYRFNLPNWSVPTSFDTTTVWNTAKAWVDGILAVGGVIVAGLLLATPEPTTVTKWLGYILLAASVARSSVAIYENIDRGLDPLDSRNVLEGVSILTAFLGLSGGALRQAGIQSIRPTTFRVGNYLILTSIAGDAGSVVYLTTQAVAQLQSVQADPTLDEGQKTMETLRLISTLIAQGTMVIVSNRDMFRGGLRWSDFARTTPGATARTARSNRDVEVNLGVGERLDIALELRRAGDLPDRLRHPSPAEHRARSEAEGSETAAPAEAGPAASYSDREIVDRFFALQWLSQDLTPAETARMLQRLDTDSLNSFQEIGSRQAFETVDRINNDAVTNSLVPEIGGAQLHRLLQETSPTNVVELHTRFGTSGVKQLTDDLEPIRIGRLLNGMTVEQLYEKVGLYGKAVFRNLADDLTGSDVLALIARHGSDGDDLVRWAAADQVGSEAQTLLTSLNTNALSGIADITGSRARQLLNQLGSDVLNNASPTVNGTNLAQLVESFDAPFARAIAEERIGAGSVGDLNDYATRLSQANMLRPGGTGELVEPSALSPDSIVADTNYIRYLNFALQKIDTGTPISDLPPVERNVLADFRRRTVSDTRVTDVTIAEAGSTPHIPAREGISLDVSRTSPEYQQVMAELASHHVGRRPSGPAVEGIADRMIVADTFFSRPSRSRATFVTTDRRVYNNLAKMAGYDLSRIGRVPDYFSARGGGFEVSISAGSITRKIWVVPISGRPSRPPTSDR